jgi:hypothetical protein
VIDAIVRYEPFAVAENDRLGSKADIPAPLADVRSPPKADIRA